jgi:hypothetical protein
VIETKTVWQCTGSEAHRDAALGLDTIILSFRSEGNTYTVSVSGRAETKAHELVGALRAAAATLINAAGGDMRELGAQTLEEAAMDTGDQRAS